MQINCLLLRRAGPGRLSAIYSPNIVTGGGTLLMEAMELCFFYSNLVLWLWLDDLYDDNSKSPEILFCFVFILLFLQLGSFRSAPDVDVVCEIVKNTIVKESLIKQNIVRGTTDPGY